jgi:hypothetical protein
VAAVSSSSPTTHISAAKHRPYSGKVVARKSVIGNKEKN